MEHQPATTRTALRGSLWLGAIAVSLAIAGCQTVDRTGYGSYSPSIRSVPASASEQYRKVVCEYPDGRREIRVAAQCSKYGRTIRDASPEDVAAISEEAPSGGSGTSPGTRDGKPLRLASVGTGFVVSRRGDVLTNAHVVDDCSHVRVSKPHEDSTPAKVEFVSEEYDLALLSTDLEPEIVARLRSRNPVRTGESIFVVGYPLRGIPASKANITTGVISARAGFRDDDRLFQITAPIQAGNSGGPVLDSRGRVVAVVVSSLNVLKFVITHGDVPQNVNFAIKGKIARSFLKGSGVHLETPHNDQELDAATVFQMAIQFTKVVECWQ